MCPSPSSPQNPAVTTSDERHVRSVKSLIHTINSPEQVAPPQPNSPLLSTQLPASPTTSISSPHHNTVSTGTSMTTIQPAYQPNNPPTQNLTTMSIPVNSNLSCLVLPEPTLQHDRPAETLSQPLDQGSVEPVCLSPKSRQSITPSFSFPGASSSATTYDRILFPSSADSQCTLSEISSTEFIPTTSQRTPNIYVNGLPPHFSERDLFSLAQPFGDIKSVRTFTRHVSEKPTGYGFVLFNDVESAQRCIDGLRKYRNLHPSFSKRVHRIPGTEYAQHIVVQSTDLDVNSFKSRMEKLQDTTSTNLYIEGLPLSTDEESLTALMQPYKIKSSRFFKTKLSNPPRIIAFVRLETRTAAEETIERLHGRMVRGWNDPGCRISVRFADSAEQRELRRAERTLKNGDQSPSRLTIAQAALLNLRGQDLQTNARDIEIANSQRLATIDDHAAFHTVPDFGSLPVSRSLPSNLRYTYKESPLPSVSDLPFSEMDNLLQSIPNMGYESRALDDTMRNLTLNNEYLMSQQAQLRALASASVALLSPDPLITTLPRGHAQARNGFTPAEELILEAHAQRHHLCAQPSQSRSMPVSSLRRNDNVQSFDSALPESLQASVVTRNSRDTLPTISEDHLHAMGYLPRSFVRTCHNVPGPDDRYRAAVPSSTNVEFLRPPSRAVSIVAPPPDYDEPGKRGKSHHQRAERSTGSRQIPSSPFNTRQIIPSAELKSHPSLPRSSTRPNNTNDTHNDDHNNLISNSRDKNIEPKHSYAYSHGDTRSYSEEDRGARFHSSSASQVYTKNSPQLGKQNSTAKAGPKSPVVVSPALTYSSRTPSTLSPATPFFGSFAGSPDTFDVMTMENEDVTERRLKGRIVNK